MSNRVPVMEDEVMRYIRLRNRGWLPSRIFRSRWRARSDRKTRPGFVSRVGRPWLATGYRFALRDLREKRRAAQFTTRFLD